MKKKTGVDLFKEKYGMDYSSYKYIMPGGEMLKHIGHDMILVHYTRDESGSWVNSFEKAFIESLSDYDPLNLTYNCKYKTSDNEEEVKEIRIIPEGYSWVEQGKEEDLQEAYRFVPASLHYKLMEDEAFFGRVAEIYDTKPTLNVEQLQNLSKSKEQDVTLRYSHNIGLAVKLDNDAGYLWIRILGLSFHHKAGTMYSLKVICEDRTFAFMVDSEKAEYDNPELYGKVKILDLAD